MKKSPSLCQRLCCSVFNKHILIRCISLMLWLMKQFTHTFTLFLITLLKYFHVILLYTSTPLRLRCKYCTFHSTHLLFYCVISQILSLAITILPPWHISEDIVWMKICDYCNSLSWLCCLKLAINNNNNKTEAHLVIVHFNLDNIRFSTSMLGVKVKGPQGEAKS